MPQPLRPEDLLDFLGPTAKIGSARGRQSGGPVITGYVRDLTEADADLLLNPPPKGSQTNAVGRMRHSHHSLARLLAEGRRPGECSMITGYSLSRISILQNDPAFQELLEYYKTSVNNVYLDVHERLATLGMSTVEELQERLESEPEKFKNRELMELAALMLDRSVAPPKNKTSDQGTNSGSGVHISVNFVQSSDPMPTIDVNPEPVPRIGD